ncbi:methanogenesis marker 17 protein [Methanoregula formicica]|uniref:Putative methanogenesis marker protein 17 n=1 Tax=Methanoregula formicica (strain DSM 22288 / NBRC 105244 / SMSP) TaxID=593750 RepID=L0HBV9_METFS|nr:methanogenesis marker 17 protein [Methanoregula formicica]AGB01291.1 putative methanogenesis marker protein 17 [Methanoregula formicica SMSP]
MQAIEHFEVECPEALGAEYYTQIANDVLLDHNLMKVIDKLHIYIDPKVPVFVAVGTLKKISTRVRIGDFANVNPMETKITLVISEETYMAPMLKILWERFGKEKVEQPDRFTVILYNVPATPQEIEEIVVADPSESLHKDLIYALRCIAPEGFRLRSEVFTGTKFKFVASENTLAEDIGTLVAEKFKLMGEVPP